MRVSVLTTAALVLMSGIAHADGTVTAPRSPIEAGPSGWRFQYTPYAWLPWINGDATVRGRDFTIDQNPGQVLDSLQFAYMSYQEARRGAITLYSDVVYAANGNSSSFARSDQFSDHVAGTVGAVVSADFKQWIVEVGGMYETNRWRMGPGAGDADTTLDLLAGGRYWHQQADVDVALAGTFNVDGLIVTGSTALARSGGIWWIDPFIGARLTYHHSPTESFVVRGDFGGFGWVSKFTWQTTATYNFYLGTQSGVTYDGYLGYRALSVDYAEGRGVDRYEFDVIQQGPVVGITGKF